jgi:hypothetical protein
VVFWNGINILFIYLMSPVYQKLGNICGFCVQWLSLHEAGSDCKNCYSVKWRLCEEEQIGTVHTETSGIVSMIETWSSWLCDKLHLVFNLWFSQQRANPLLKY